VSVRAVSCRLPALLIAAPLWLLLGCADGAAWSGPPPAADLADFEATVYPVLLRDCAFSECHGERHRFFQVYGPGRARLDPEAEPTAPATEDEKRVSYRRAMEMLATDARADRSLLLTKPLEARAGGQGHEGTDTLGRNVYASRLDPAYVAIQAWALRATGQGGSLR
jgi:hypothetical protein